jgi:endonuclease YncB( thermonuclease family)
MYHTCRVSRVVDADTYKGTVDLDFGVSISITIRLLGCDAYEITGDEKKLGIEAKQFVETLIAGSLIQIEPVKQDSFGRWLCDVIVGKSGALVELLKKHNYLKARSSKN